MAKILMKRHLIVTAECYANELIHRHCGTNNRAPRWTFTDPYKPEVRPGAREESASPAWLAAPNKNNCRQKLVNTIKIIDKLPLNTSFRWIKLLSLNVSVHKIDAFSCYFEIK